MLSQSTTGRFWQRKPASFLIAFFGVICTTGVLDILHAGNNLANIFMVYILVVIITAVQLGRVAAILAAITSFISIDFFFVEPHFNLVITEPTEWLALTVFLMVAIITGQLTAKLRVEVQNTLQHDAEMTTLAETSWQVASEYDNEIALKHTLENTAKLLNLKELAVILFQEDGALRIHSTYGMTEVQSQQLLSGPNVTAINSVRDKALPIGPYAPNFPNPFSGQQDADSSALQADQEATFLPIHIDGTVKGITYLHAFKSGMANPREHQMLQALVNHIVLILQREKSIESEAKAQALLEANKLKNALLSMVSHDFRSPLTAIKASIQTLKSAGSNLSPEVTKTLLDAVDHETERINKMVTNILDLSRLEAGAWGPKCEVIPVSELIGSVLSAFNDQETSRVILKNTVGAVGVFIDGVQLEQVLKNLLENALKYSKPEEKVELECRFEGETLIVDVCDRGIGLSYGEEAKVFEPFYRGKKLSESNVPGVGIGLSICKGLVEAHGGIITAIKREGGGSIFRVTLPNRYTEE